MLRFWTQLQHPTFQAVLVEDGRPVAYVPGRAPKSPTRRIGVVGEYEDHCVSMALHSSFEMWTDDGAECLASFYHPYIYAPHAITEFDGDVLICSSGLDLFFIMTPDGDVLWEWFGGKNGLGVFPEHAMREDWPTRHNSGKSYQLEGGAHFNSIWMEPSGDSFLTSSLYAGKVIRITPFEQGYEDVATVTEHGVHSPILTEQHGLVYGKERGIVADGTEILKNFDWVKFIRETPEGFVFTHEEGVTFTDGNWGFIRTVPLPRPFQLAHLEL